MLRVCLGAVLFACLCLPAWAQRAPVVVELFTSQGCSSCPPADAMLHDLAARDDIIALALHVDYWDYIGWKDEFADPRNAKRQRAYARTAERRAVYTPEFIIGGVTEVVGAKPTAVARAISEHQAREYPVRVKLERAGTALRVELEPMATLDGPLEVHMLHYRKSRPARITRGENAGRDFVYAQVTEGWQVLGAWDGTSAATVEAMTADDLPVVVLVQQPNGGPILGAARLR